MQKFLIPGGNPSIFSWLEAIGMYMVRMGSRNAGYALEGFVLALEDLMKGKLVNFGLNKIKQVNHHITSL